MVIWHPKGGVSFTLSTEGPADGTTTSAMEHSAAMSPQMAAWIAWSAPWAVEMSGCVTDDVGLEGVKASARGVLLADDGADARAACGAAADGCSAGGAVRPGQ